MTPTPSASTVSAPSATTKTATAESATEVLARVWGYPSFRPLQARSIDDVLAGRDSVTILPTGGGKSLCYQVPAMVRDGMAVVVSPLISLMKDQVDALRTAGVAAELINSTLSDSQKVDVARRIRGGEVDLLYVAPEKLMSPRMIDFLRDQSVSFFAIDEAHCVSNWGHDFRPEYRQLGELKRYFPDASVHAFTATASAKVRDDIAAQLELHDPSMIIGGFDRPNLNYAVVPRGDRMTQIVDVIRRHPSDPGIVYAITRKEVTQIAEALVASGVSAVAYHAGLDDIERRQNQDRFIRDEVDVVVATVAFGMGIDKANVRYVVHAGMPKSIEHYQQESGRAGRDGLPSDCVLIHGGGDLMTWKRILEMGDTSNFQSAFESVRAMASFCATPTCRHKMLVEHFGESYPADNCGACDVCLGQLDLVDDSLLLAQKILSGVYRCGGRFGGGHVARMLTGSRDAKIVANGHDQLSTHGLLSDFPASVVRGWIDQLINQGYAQNVGEYAVVELTRDGLNLLKLRSGTDQSPVRLIAPAKKADKGSRPNKLSDAESWEGVDRGLFESLRGLRKRLAGEAGVPAYVVFGDRELRTMAKVRPTDRQTLAAIPGVGETKLAKFGDAFIQCITKHCEATGADPNQPADVHPNKTSPNKTSSNKTSTTGASASIAIRRAGELMQSGLGVDAIAKQLGRARSTTIGYLESFILENGVGDLSNLVETDQIERVEMTFFDHPDEEKLKPIREALGGEVSYDDLRLISARLRSRHTA